MLAITGVKNDTFLNEQWLNIGGNVYLQQHFPKFQLPLSNETGQQSKPLQREDYINDETVNKI